MKYIFTILCILFSHRIIAHEGPAYPLLVDQLLKDSKVSIWADPDTGNGTFTFYLEGADSADFSIEIVAWPKGTASPHLNTEAHKAEAQVGKTTYSAQVPFNESMMWNVEFVFKQKGIIVNKIALEVEVTPPGPNKWEFALYFLPFLLVGFLWVKVVLAKRKISAATKTHFPLP